MQLTDKNGNVYGWNGLEIIGSDGKPKNPGSFPIGPAGGDLSGTYPNPNVIWNNGLSTYNSQYYPLSANPAGYITAAALSPYLTITSAASTYYPLTNPSGYISGITGADVITALGYTPYNATNPAGYITSAALSPYLTSALAASTYYPLTNPAGYIDSTALAPYLTSATAAATYYPLTNPAGYISGITSGDVTTALGYTPYDAANPAGYISSAALSPYLTIASAAATYQPLLTYLIFIETLADLPTPVAGVITLLDNVTYFITAAIDLVGSRLVAGVNTTIIGGSSENCRLKSTGLIGTALITSNYSLPMRNITIEANVALDLQGDGVTTALDWFGVNFTDCATVGLVKDYTNFIMADSAFLNSGNLTFDGTIGTVGFSQCLFNCNAGGTVFILPATLTITRRFRVIYSSFLVLAGETGINVDLLTSIPNDGYILTYCNFSGGGTYLANINNSSNKALFINNIGIGNSSNVGHYYMQDNTTTTPTTTTGLWVKANGTTTEGVGNSPKWTTAVDNRLTYVGSVSTDFVMTVVGSVRSSSQNVTLGVGIAENGTVQAEAVVSVRIPNANQPFAFSLQDVISVSSGNYYEVFLRNETGTNATVLNDVNVIIQKVTG